MMQPRTIFLWAGLLGVGLACLAGWGCGPRQERVVIGQQTWTGATAIEHILAEVIEKHLDTPVDLVPVSAATCFAGMDRGNGSVDVFADFWLPNMSGVHARFIAEGSRETIQLNQRPYSGDQGFYVPRNVKEELGIRRIEQLRDPEVARLFDIDGDGKGDYWAGRMGWRATDVNRVKAKSYGFAKHFTALTVSQAVMEKLLEMATKDRKPILVFFWAPERVISQYDLVLLEEPPFDGYAMPSKKNDPQYNPDGSWFMLDSSEDPAWFQKSRVTCAWPEAQIHVAYSRSLETRLPRVARFLRQVFFTREIVSGWIHQIEEQGQDPRKMAREWIEQHPEMVRQWLRGTHKQTKGETMARR